MPLLKLPWYIPFSDPPKYHIKLVSCTINIYIYCTTYSLFADDCPIISHYKHPFTTVYNTNCFPVSSCHVCIQYYSMILSWLVKLNCIPIYMLSCELK
jgi:hypothetical protein